MEKKTKLWLGAGVLAVGAYLLWKSKQATAVAAPAVTAAKFVGADSSFFKPETKKYGHKEGVFANANASQKMENSFFDVKGKKDGEFKNATSYKKGFANQPFNFAGVDAPVGQRKMPFADTVGKNQKFNAGGPKQGNFKQVMGNTAEDSFNAPYSQMNNSVASSKIKAPVMPKAVTQAKPLTNLVGANGLINGAAVHSVWGK